MAVQFYLNFIRRFCLLVRLSNVAKFLGTTTTTNVTCSRDERQIGRCAMETKRVMQNKRFISSTKHLPTIKYYLNKTHLPVNLATHLVVEP